MRAERLFPTIFKALVVLRVGHAVLLLGGVLAYRLYGAAPFPIDEYVSEVLQGIPVWYFVIWGVFVVGYMLAAACLLLQSFWALPLYSAAFATDFFVSLYWFQQPGMDRAYSGSADVVEWGLNVFDLSVIAVLVLASSAFIRPAD